MTHPGRSRFFLSLAAGIVFVEGIRAATSHDAATAFAAMLILIGSGMILDVSMRRLR